MTVPLDVLRRHHSTCRPDSGCETCQALAEVKRLEAERPNLTLWRGPCGHFWEKSESEACPVCAEIDERAPDVARQACAPDDSQRFVISDEHTFCFGHGTTLEAAVEDFKVACAERCAILAEEPKP